MARTKGSRNKNTVSIDERIGTLSNDIDGLMSEVKSKKAELRKLRREKVDYDRNRIMDAVAASGKSCDEIVDMLNNAG